MRPIIWTCLAISIAACIVVAQDPPGPPAFQGKGAPREPSQSPASRPVPKTVNAQSYPAELVKVGEQRFVAQCGFCHGRDAAGGETGPDLTRSKLVAEDSHGDK